MINHHQKLYQVLINKIIKRKLGKVFLLQLIKSQYSQIFIKLKHHLMLISVLNFQEMKVFSF